MSSSRPLPLRAQRRPPLKATAGARRIKRQKRKQPADEEEEGNVAGPPQSDMAMDLDYEESDRGGEGALDEEQRSDPRSSIPIPEGEIPVHNSPPPFHPPHDGPDTVPISRNPTTAMHASDEDPATDLPNFEPVIDDVRIAQKFADILKDAKLGSDVEPLPEDVIKQIRSPDEDTLSVDDPDNRFSLDVFLSLANDPESSYNDVRTAYLKRWPNAKMLSYYQVNKLVTQLSGVVPVMRDMCIDSCMAYTGPLAQLDSCMFCGKSRWTSESVQAAKKVPQQQFMTLLISPMIQALWRTKEGAERMKYRTLCTERVLQEMKETGRVSRYSDFFQGTDYLKAYNSNVLNPHDPVLMMSVDGAQLYRNKASDCWMQIWVVLDQSPDVRYKKEHVHPGTFIPGPNKPRLLDSFMFPGLYHLVAVMNEGLPIWDASTGATHTSRPFLALVTADGPGMACLNGFVGHNGKCHCRLYCPLVGRHKSGKKTYYPARQKPHDYHVAGCLHDDVDLYDLLAHLRPEDTEKRYEENLAKLKESPNPTQYAKRRLETGLCKPSIFSGVPRERRLGIPGLFPGDCMHLPCLNIPDLLIPLWRGLFECDSKDSKQYWDWIFLDPEAFAEQGKLVAGCKPYLPSSFDRIPRNPAEKINSGYKAWEFLIWFYVLGPGLFHGAMPEKYWVHYCKLVRAMRLMLQHEITRDNIREAHSLFVQFCDDFETLYVQRKPERLHFVRPSIHAPAHMPGEVTRIGPGIISSQWTMERTIGNLVEEIRQHSDPYSNLAQRGLRRCQLNALRAMIPDLSPPPPPLPRGSYDAGEGYALLTATDSSPHTVPLIESAALANYLVKQGQRCPVQNWKPCVYRYARCRLPTGQDARSRWKEEPLPLDHHQINRCVKLSIDSKTEFAEVHYFFILQHGDIIDRAVGIGSFFGPPDEELYEKSSRTFYLCEDRKDRDVRVFDVHSIEAVVAMVLDERKSTPEQKRWFVGEKPGLSVGRRVGTVEGASGVPQEQEEEV